MAPHIKPVLKSSELTTDQPADVRRRLASCLASDAAHIVPGSSGTHVQAIQDALRKIGAARPALGLPDINDAPGLFGDDTVAAVHQYKDGGNLAGDQIVRTGQPLDDIVGRMTITQIDDDLLVIKKPVPPPKPEPKPTPLPVVGGANAFVGFMGRGESKVELILDYYRNCGLETIGPGQIDISAIERFNTFEGLIDRLLATNKIVNVVVNHGDFANGLLIQLCPESKLRNTSLVIGALSELADRAQNKPLDMSDPDTRVFMTKVTFTASISQHVVTRIVDKLVQLRKKPRVIHLRACKMEFSSIVAQYKKAFRALAMTFHGTRIIFQRVDPHIPNSGKPVATIFDESPDSSAERRFRKFESEDLATLMVGLIVQLNEEGDVKHQESVQLIDRRNVTDLDGWAEALIRRWKASTQRGFIVPIMWADTDETTFHCPLELGWRQKLQII